MCFKASKIITQMLFSTSSLYIVSQVIIHWWLFKVYQLADS